MNHQTKFALIVTTMLAVMSIGSDLSATNRYGSATIENATTASIIYRYKWGKNGDWKRATVQAGRSLTHTWPYQVPNENKSPTLYVRFDADLQVTDFWQSYKLGRQAVPDRTPFAGAHYRFRFDGGTSRYVDLVKYTKPRMPKHQPHHHQQYSVSKGHHPHLRHMHSLLHH